MYPIISQLRTFVGKQWNAGNRAIESRPFQAILVKGGKDLRHTGEFLGQIVQTVHGTSGAIVEGMKEYQGVAHREEQIDVIVDTVAKVAKRWGKDALTTTEAVLKEAWSDGKALREAFLGKGPTNYDDESFRTLALALGLPTTAQVRESTQIPPIQDRLLKEANVGIITFGGTSVTIPHKGAMRKFDLSTGEKTVKELKALIQNAAQIQGVNEVVMAAPGFPVLNADGKQTGHAFPGKLTGIAQGGYEKIGEGEQTFTVVPISELTPAGMKLKTYNDMAPVSHLKPSIRDLQSQGIELNEQQMVIVCGGGGTGVVTPEAVVHEAGHIVLSDSIIELLPAVFKAAVQSCKQAGRVIKLETLSSGGGAKENLGLILTTMYEKSLLPEGVKQALQDVYQSNGHLTTENLANLSKSGNVDAKELLKEFYEATGIAYSVLAQAKNSDVIVPSAGRPETELIYPGVENKGLIVVARTGGYLKGPYGDEEFLASLNEGLRKGLKEVGLQNEVIAKSGVVTSDTPLHGGPDLAGLVDIAIRQ